MKLKAIGREKYKNPLKTTSKDTRES